MTFGGQPEALSSEPFQNLNDPPGRGCTVSGTRCPSRIDRRRHRAATRCFLHQANELPRAAHALAVESSRRRRP